MTQSHSRPQPEGGRGLRIDWSAVLSQHDRWLRTVVYAWVGESQAVDEVMQEVSLAAVRQQAPLADAQKAAPWLYRLAVTCSLLHRRKQGRGRKLIDRYAECRRPTEADRQGDPLDWLLAKERRGQVRVRWPECRVRRGVAVVEIYGGSGATGNCPNTWASPRCAIEARLHRARGRLRAELTALEIVGTET